MLRSVGSRIRELDLLRQALSSGDWLSWSSLGDVLRWATITRLDRDAVQDLVHRVASDKRIILTVTTGRSGTGTLRRLLGCLDVVEHHHEPEPHFARCMRISQVWPRAAYYFLVHSKLPAIAAAEKPIYVETSHLSCKGLLEPMFEVGLRPDLILLHRDARSVARSIIRLDTAPGRTTTGVTYYLHPGDRGTLAYPNWREANDYQLAYWYALEIDRRQEHYAKQAAALGCRVVYADIDELNDLPSALRLFKALDLTPSAIAMKRLKNRLGRRFNHKHDEGEADSYTDAQLEGWESAVLEATGLSRSTTFAARMKPAAA